MKFFYMIMMFTVLSAIPGDHAVDEHIKRSVPQSRAYKPINLQKSQKFSAWQKIIVSQKAKKKLDHKKE